MGNQECMSSVWVCGWMLRLTFPKPAANAARLSEPMLHLCACITEMQAK